MYEVLLSITTMCFALVCGQSRGNSLTFYLKEEYYVEEIGMFNVSCFAAGPGQ